MRIRIRVIPNSKKQEIRKENNTLIIKIKEKAEKGKANKAVINMLSTYFKKRKNKIKIVRGFLNKEKIIEVD